MEEIPIRSSHLISSLSSSFNHTNNRIVLQSVEQPDTECFHEEKEQQVRNKINPTSKDVIVFSDDENFPGEINYPVVNLEVVNHHEEANPDPVIIGSE